MCKVDDLYGTEWSYIPHFYRNFYVYQYATSMVASSSLAERIRLEATQKPTGESKPVTTARDAYLKMLSAGSSKYPIDLLKDAGVDMTTSAPFNAAIDRDERHHGPDGSHPKEVNRSGVRSCISTLMVQEQFAAAG